ncbi:hypothetical protein C2H92_02185 [Bacillus halotolerans]|nr:hypothetical protein C2H92_02185 [Bacillus halotolerans]
MYFIGVLVQPGPVLFCSFGFCRSQLCVILDIGDHIQKVMIFMNKEILKYIFTIFSICAVLQETDDMSIAHSWILTEIVRFLICAAVFIILTFLLETVFPNKKESH